MTETKATKITAAPMKPALAEGFARSFAGSMKYLSDAAARAFLDTVEKTEIAIEAHGEKEGRTFKVHAHATAWEVANRGDHNMAGVLAPVLAFLDATTRGRLPKGARLSASHDTRGKKASLGWNLVLGDVPKRDVEAVSATLKDLLARYLPGALHEGIAFARHVLDAISAAAEADAALRDAAKAAVEAADARTNYKAKLAALHEERRNAADASLAQEGFLSLSPDAGTLITPQARLAALDEALDTSFRVGHSESIVKPRLD